MRASRFSQGGTRRRPGGVAAALSFVGIIALVGALIGGIVGPTGGGSTPDVLAVAEQARQTEKQKTRAASRNAAVLLAAGDIADCGSSGDEETAKLIRRMDGTIATLGDNVYEDGTKREFANCYDPSWGTEKSRTRPAPGNHEYNTRGAKGYFAYFGNAAGDRGKGYYSYDLGDWHIIALNSNCAQVGGCEAESPQGQWLRQDLAAHPATCTLAYWHHPLFTSGNDHGPDEAMRPFWQILYDAGADVVLSGHEHNYERFAPQDPQGNRDEKRGIRQFVVGTGGRSHYGFGKPLPTSEVRNDDTFGVLKLTLHPTSYDWEFVPVDSGRAFTDSGSDNCRGGDKTGGQDGGRARQGKDRTNKDASASDERRRQQRRADSSQRRANRPRTNQVEPQGLVSPWPIAPQLPANGLRCLERYADNGAAKNRRAESRQTPGAWWLGCRRIGVDRAGAAGIDATFPPLELPPHIGLPPHLEQSPVGVAPANPAAVSTVEPRRRR